MGAGKATQGRSMRPLTKNKLHIHHQTPKHLVSTLNYKVKSSHGTEGYVSISHDCLTSARFHVTCAVNVFSAICRNDYMYIRMSVSYIIRLIFPKSNGLFQKLNQVLAREFTFQCCNFIYRMRCLSSEKKSTAIYLSKAFIFGRTYYSYSMFLFDQVFIQIKSFTCG